MLQLMIRAGHHVMAMCCSRMPEGEKEQKDEIIMPVDHTEKGFEQAIEDHLIQHGYRKGDPAEFDAPLAGGHEDNRHTQK